MSATTKTEVCALFGNPVGQSLSPAMHNAAFRDKGLDLEYLAFKVERKNLENAVSGARALGFRGINITIPHKVRVIPLLDHLDPVSKKIGAVNTVVAEGGVLTGYNTDAGGFIRVLSLNSFDPDGKNAVVLGSGGAAMAVCYALVESGCHVTILNRARGLSHATDLAARLNSPSKNAARALPLDGDNIKAALQAADILVNATSVGMHPYEGQSIVPVEFIKPPMVVFDLVYNPVETELMKTAAQAGAHVIGGLEMLVWQGALAFELWTGLSAPLRVMRQAALARLETGPGSSQQGLPAGRQNIALVGFMGSGKSTVARIISRKTGRRLVELDRMIETDAGLTIPQIFARKGQTGFREMEIEAVKTVSAQPNQVISCGGGVVLNTINIDRLRASSIIVYLEVSQDQILARLARQKVEKPVLTDPADPEEISKLLVFREPFYRAAADITIDSSRLSAEETAGRIIAEVRKYERSSK